MERRAQGVKLAADQPATPFRPPLQTRPPLPPAAKPHRGRRPAVALRLPHNDRAGDDPAPVEARDEQTGEGVEKAELSGYYGLEGV